MSKLSAIALAVLGLASSSAFAQTCSNPDPSATVVFGSRDSGVANRAVAGTDGCTIEDLILDEQAWGSQSAFLAHVSSVSLDLLKKGVISTSERVRLNSAAQASGVGTTLAIKIAAINDFHGNLRGPSGTVTVGSSRISAGGVAKLAAKVEEITAKNPNHVVVSAGDLIGASPLISALFHDEPTIEAMNRLGLDINAVGNHEFDEGREELLRMAHGGSHPSDPNTSQGLPADLNANGQFGGAKFQFLAANVTDAATGKTLFPAYTIKEFLGNKVAFIGMTLEATPSIVSPSGVAGLNFADEADTVNALVPQLTAQGVQAIVVVVHEGGVPTSGGINDCVGVSGAIVDIVNRLDPEVDLVVSGHTHRAYNCVMNGMALTSAGQYGQQVTEIDLTLDTKTRDVKSVVANNQIVTQDLVDSAPLAELVNHYSALSTPLENAPIGSISADITRTANASGESALGDVIADAQLEDTASAERGAAVISFMNPGGIRADLLFAASGSETTNGQVTYGEAFTVQPFGNTLTTMTLTGAQIKTLLETQFTGCNGQTSNRFLQVSRGFTYSYVAAGECNSRIDPADIKLDGVTLDANTGYRVTVNSFLADGGDNFGVLRDGTDRLPGGLDLDALRAFFEAHPEGVAPGPQNRYTAR